MQTEMNLMIPDNVIPNARLDYERTMIERQIDIELKRSLFRRSDIVVIDDSYQLSDSSGLNIYMGKTRSEVLSVLREL